MSVSAFIFNRPARTAQVKGISSFQSDQNRRSQTPEETIRITRIGGDTEYNSGTSLNLATTNRQELKDGGQPDRKKLVSNSTTAHNSTIISELDRYPIGGPEKSHNSTISNIHKDANGSKTKSGSPFFLLEVNDERNSNGVPKVASPYSGKEEKNGKTQSWNEDSKRNGEKVVQSKSSHSKTDLRKSSFNANKSVDNGNKDPEKSRNGKTIADTTNNSKESHTNTAQKTITSNSVEKIDHVKTLSRPRDDNESFAWNLYNSTEPKQKINPTRSISTELGKKEKDLDSISDEGKNFTWKGYKSAESTKKASSQPFNARTLRNTPVNDVEKMGPKLDEDKKNFTWKGYNSTEQLSIGTQKPTPSKAFGEKSNKKLEQPKKNMFKTIPKPASPKPIRVQNKLGSRNGQEKKFTGNVVGTSSSKMLKTLPKKSPDSTSVKVGGSRLKTNKEMPMKNKPNLKVKNSEGGRPNSNSKAAHPKRFQTGSDSNKEKGSPKTVDQEKVPGSGDITKENVSLKSADTRSLHKLQNTTEKVSSKQTEGEKVAGKIVNSRDRVSNVSPMSTPMSTDNKPLHNLQSATNKIPAKQGEKGIIEGYTDIDNSKERFSKVSPKSTVTKFIDDAKTTTDKMPAKEGEGEAITGKFDVSQQKDPGTLPQPFDLKALNDLKRNDNKILIANQAKEKNEFTAKLDNWKERLSSFNPASLNPKALIGNKKPRSKVAIEKGMNDKVPNSKEPKSNPFPKTAILKALEDDRFTTNKVTPERGDQKQVTMEAGSSQERLSNSLPPKPTTPKSVNNSQGDDEKKVNMMPNGQKKGGISTFTSKRVASSILPDSNDLKPSLSVKSDEKKKKKFTGKVDNDKIAFPKSTKPASFGISSNQERPAMSNSGKKMNDVDNSKIQQKPPQPTSSNSPMNSFVNDQREQGLNTPPGGNDRVISAKPSNPRDISSRTPQSVNNPYNYTPEIRKMEPEQFERKVTPPPGRADRFKESLSDSLSRTRPSYSATTNSVPFNNDKANQSRFPGNRDEKLPVVNVDFSKDRVPKNPPRYRDYNPQSNNSSYNQNERWQDSQNSFRGEISYPNLKDNPPSSSKTSTPPRRNVVNTDRARGTRTVNFSSGRIDTSTEEPRMNNPKSIYSNPNSENDPLVTNGKGAGLQAQENTGKISGDTLIQNFGKELSKSKSLSDQSNSLKDENKLNEQLEKLDLWQRIREQYKDNSNIGWVSFADSNPGEKVKIRDEEKLRQLRQLEKS